MEDFCRSNLKFVCLILLIFCNSCSKDDDNDITYDGCLNKSIIEMRDLVCENFSNPDCEIIELGQKSLSEQIKSEFTDYCNAETSKIDFINSVGEQLTAEIKRREFKQFMSTTTLTSSSGQICQHRCLEAELAEIDVISKNFGINLRLNSGLGRGTNRDIIEGSVSSYNIAAYSNYTPARRVSQFIFRIEVEDFYDNRIMPDTTNVRYHNSIVLNGKMFSDVYSNENNKAEGIRQKEIVYFGIKEGLIGVCDSIGIMWTVE